MDGDLLLCIGGSQFGLSDGERNLSPRVEGACNRVLLNALGTGIGGVAGPWLFGWLIDSGSRWSVYGGYLFGSVLMLAAAVIAARYAVAAERKPLESVCRPLSAIE
jgi:MFS family permease